PAAGVAPTSGAARQLLNLLTNPKVIGALAGLAQGTIGGSAGSASAPGGLAQLLGSLARLADHAAEEALSGTESWHEPRDSLSPDSLDLLADHLAQAVERA
ncbi:hypothetical protein ACFOD4_20520, partial [Pseudoroseomonas globiformis]